jgi:hypothetical protein
MPLAGITFFFDADQKRILVESIATWRNWMMQVDENTLRQLCGPDVATPSHLDSRRRGRLRVRSAGRVAELHGSLER